LTDANKCRLELCDEPFDVLELNDAFDFFDNIRTTFSNSTEMHRHTHQALLPSLDFESLRNTFEMLTSTFSFTLTTRVPKAYRVKRAYILRSIATELFLAHIQIPRDFVPLQRAVTPERRELNADPAQLTLPIHPSSPEQRRDKGKQRALPEEIQTSSSPPPNNLGDKQAPAITKWVQFSKPVHPILENVQRQLAHWQLGVDPSVYDFVSLAVLDRDEHELMQLQKEDRERKQREAKRNRVQQIKQDLITQKLSQIQTSTDALHLGDQLAAVGSLAAGKTQTSLKAALRNLKVSQSQTQKVTPRNISQTQPQTQTQTQVQSEKLSPTLLPDQPTATAQSLEKQAPKGKPSMKKKKRVKGFG
jgi:hypothetical protein